MESMGKWQFEGGKGRPTIKYRDTLRSSVQKQLNRWDGDAVWFVGSDWQKESCVRLGSQWEGAILGKGAPIVKYRDTLHSPVRKQLNRSKCRLDYGLGLAQGIMNWMGSRFLAQEGATSVQ